MQSKSVYKSCLRDDGAMIRGRVMDDLLDFFGDDGGVLFGAGELRWAVEFVLAAAAARGGNAKWKKKKDEDYNSSDDYSNDRP